MKMMTFLGQNSMKTLLPDFATLLEPLATLKEFCTPIGQQYFTP